jgi:hypothetical protein
MMATIKEGNTIMSFVKDSRLTVTLQNEKLLSTGVADILAYGEVDNVTITYRNGDYVELKREEVNG